MSSRSFGRAAGSAQKRVVKRSQREMTRHASALAIRTQSWRLFEAERLRERAAGGVGTAGRRIGSRRGGQRRGAHLVEPRSRIDELARIGVRGPREQNGARPG